MERRIKPWVNKKIVEYIGEPEPTLVEFICSKVLIGSQPQNIINDVQMVNHISLQTNICFLFYPFYFS
jgi:RNA-binding protein 25